MNTEEDPVEIEARSSTDDIQTMGVVNSGSSGDETQTKEAKGEFGTDETEPNKDGGYVSSNKAEDSEKEDGIGRKRVDVWCIRLKLRSFGATSARMKLRPARARRVGIC